MDLFGCSLMLFKPMLYLLYIAANYMQTVNNVIINSKPSTTSALQRNPCYSKPLAVLRGKMTKWFTMAQLWAYWKEDPDYSPSQHAASYKGTAVEWKIKLKSRMDLQMWPKEKNSQQVLYIKALINTAALAFSSPQIKQSLSSLQNRI